MEGLSYRFISMKRRLLRKVTYISVLYFMRMDFSLTFGFLVQLHG